MNQETFTLREHTLADQAIESDRAEFIVKTYTHLFGAILATIVLETALLLSPIGEAVFSMMSRMAGGMGWLLVLGAFIFVSYIAEKWARDTASLGMQYAGLALYVVAWSILLLPLLYIGAYYSSPDVIPTAAIVTLLAFTGLTAVVFFTRKNFNFLGPVLGVASLVALGLIVCSVLFGFSLGILFVSVLILLACGYIVYHTSAVLHEYRIGQHVAASLALYASVALLFYYVLQFTLLSRD